MSILDNRLTRRKRFKKTVFDRWNRNRKHQVCITLELRKFKAMTYPQKHGGIQRKHPNIFTCVTRAAAPSVLLNTTLSALPKFLPESANYVLRR